VTATKAKSILELIGEKRGADYVEMARQFDEALADMASDDARFSVQMYQLVGLAVHAACDHCYANGMNVGDVLTALCGAFGFAFVEELDRADFCADEMTALSRSLLQDRLNSALKHAIDQIRKNECGKLH